ncbi:MAG: sigma-54 interaction domain-containing protein [Acidobacteriota bacterium]
MLNYSLKMNLLLLSDKKEYLSSFKNFLTPKGFNFFFSSKEENFYSLIREKEIRLIVLDLSENEINNFDILKSIKDFDPLVEIIIIGPKIPASKMIDAIKQGAIDYLIEPLDAKMLQPILDNIREKTLLRRETYKLEKELAEKYVFQGMVGKNPFMLEVFSLIERVAKHQIAVLITGETGTGKELVARAIHELSAQQEKRLVVCDCTAIPDTLFESELFGYSKGAFTGADKAREGLFKEADGGTIFLDEIGEIPVAVQTKLLRVLEEHRFRPLGSSKNIRVNVRVISATSRDLKEDIRKGNFREDLFHRINAVEIKLPPLRQRKEDIPLLFRYFLDKFNHKINKNVLGFSQRAQKVLLNYPWPGNVRELENIIERAIMFCQEKVIDIKDLPDPFRNYLKENESVGYPPDSSVLTLEELEKKHILSVLQKTSNNKQKAAQLLGLSRQALYRKLNKYRIRY